MADQVKEDLSRMEGTYGAELIGKLKKMDVYIRGLRGLGLETAKNLILTGPHLVMVQDDEKATHADLGSNFYLTEADVGKPRGPAVLAKLAELNPNVTVKLHTGAVTEEFIRQFQVVVVADNERPENLTKWNAWTRANKGVFLYGSIMGMQASIFADYGDKFTCQDEDGEPLKTLVVDSISNGKNGIVTIDGERHLLADGDHVQFEEVKGMSDDAKAGERKHFGLNDVVTDINQTFEVKTTKNPKAFLIGNTTSLGEYKSGGMISQLKVPRDFHHKSFHQQQLNPTFEVGYTDFMKFGREAHIHIARLAVGQFHQEKGHLPRLHNTEDADAVVGKAKAIAAANKRYVEEKKGEALVVDPDVDEKIVRFIALYAAVDHTSMAALFGGVLAQEITKQTGKYRPLNQWFHFDAFECLDEKTPSDSKLLNSRYDNQIGLFGKAFQDHMSRQRVFLVGSGALGCEYMKSFATLGLGVNGRVFITDDDNIELSNLSRQFLFRRQHVGKPKSLCAAEAVVAMNPELKTNLKDFQIRVEPKTETTFDDAFWGDLDLVVNALDNMQARKYIDSKCVLYEKPLFESGTLGTKANTAMCVPHKTPSYSEGVVAGEGQGIAKCTLRNFPSLPLHCIEWAREKFDDWFVVGADLANNLLEDRAAFFKKLKANPLEERDSLELAKKWLMMSKSPSLQVCVEIMYEEFHRQFRDQINDLTTNFPADARNSRTTDDGKVIDLGPFWHGHKRFPKSLTFNPEEPQQVDFVFHGANVIASIFGIPEGSREEIIAITKRLTPHEWKFSGKKVELEEDKKERKEGEAAPAPEVGDDDKVAIQALTKELSELDLKSFKPLKATDFEKDNDANHHIDLLHSATNLRSINYQIKESKRQEVRMVAGRIIPAIATTTAMITGFIQLEIIKYLKKVPLESHRMATVNLGTNTFCVELLPDPIKKKSGMDPETVMPVVAIPEGFTTWDRIDVKAVDVTLEQFLANFPKVHHGVTLGMLTSLDGKVVYLSTMQESYARNKERKLLDIYEEVAGKVIPASRKYILLESTGEDAEGNLAIIPKIRAFVRA
jgi:ubiquitin-activating enzyme E1